MTRPVTFLFSGQETPPLSACVELYNRHPVFQLSFDRCDVIAAELSGISLSGVLREQKIDSLSWQPFIFAFQYSLFKLLKQHNITPTVVLGHSIGEYTAACVGGYIDIDTALRMMIQRSEATLRAAPSGSMYAIYSDRATVESAVDAFPNVYVAAYNAQDAHVISGLPDQVTLLITMLEEQDIMCAPLNISYPYHSPLMVDVASELKSAFLNFQCSSGHTTFISAISGQPENSALKTCVYWLDHLIKPVRFIEAVASLPARPKALALEIGPTGSLHGLVATTRPDLVYKSSLSGRRSASQEFSRCVESIQSH